MRTNLLQLVKAKMKSVNDCFFRQHYVSAVVIKVPAGAAVDLGRDVCHGGVYGDGLADLLVVAVADYHRQAFVSQVLSVGKHHGHLQLKNSSGQTKSAIILSTFSYYYLLYFIIAILH